MEHRKSNIELLRIVSIAMIVVFHCSIKSRFSFEFGIFSVNKLAVKCFLMLGELGVDLFMLISGYFMVSGRFKWKKLIRMLAEAQFYYWLTLLIGSRVGACELPRGKDLFLAFFPVTLNRCGWFLTVYILIYLLSPYLNLLIRAMDERTYRRFLLTVLTLFCVIPTFFGLFFNDTETLLFYNRLIWLIIVYFLGAYINLYGQNGDIGSIFSKRHAVWLTAASAAVMVISILVIDRLCGLFAAIGTTEPAYFWPPNTIPMVCLSIGVFVIFLHIELPYNRVINKLASTTLGIYLLHDGVLPVWLWRSLFRCAEFQDSPYLIPRILGASAAVLLVGCAVDLIRQALEKYILGKLADARPRDDI